MAILDDIKNELRVSGTDFDTEITALINTAKSDLAQSGVRKVVDTDPLTKMAIVLFVKGNFGWDNPEADRFMRLYENLRVKLGVASDYSTYILTFAVTDSSDDSAIDEATITIDDADGTTLTTNSQGNAYYYAREKLIDVDYTVSKLGFTAVTGSVYIDGTDETVAVEL